MNVMVADTSTLMDLERGKLLEPCFSLPFEFTVPDLLYRRELAIRYEDPDYGESLLALGLKVEELHSDEVLQAITYQKDNSALSLSDSFSLALAVTRRWTLLAGEGALRTLAMNLGIVCHGILWLIDQMFEVCESRTEELLLGLRAIRDHPRCRLPEDEIGNRLRLHESYANQP